VNVTRVEKIQFEINGTVLKEKTRPKDFMMDFFGGFAMNGPKRSRTFQKMYFILYMVKNLRI
jgi:hypothetical protein